MQKLHKYILIIKPSEAFKDWLKEAARKQHLPTKSIEARYVLRKIKRQEKDAEGGLGYHLTRETFIYPCYGNLNPKPHCRV